MTDDVREEPEPDGEPGPWGREDYEWAATGPVAVFVSRMEMLRQGQSGHQPLPVAAMLALREFAVRRPIDELVTAAGEFRSHQDTVQVLATAALRRSPRDAAKLVIAQWETELRAAEAELPDSPAATPVTDGIIHDIASQRTDLDFADFIWNCVRRGRTEIAERAIQVFTGQDSGRTHRDRAQVYIALRDAGCHEQAADALRETLKLIAERSVRRPTTELADLLRIFHRLSPSEWVVEAWVGGQLGRGPTGHPQRVESTRTTVARLIAGSKEGEEPLVEYVGRELPSNDIVVICNELIHDAPEKCTMIRRHAASRGDFPRSFDEFERLAGIVKEWHRSTDLTRTTRDLMADVVARGSAAGAGPRSVEELESFATALENDIAGPECVRLLWYAAAVHTDGRSGRDLAELLGKVEHSRDRRRAEQAIARNLSGRLLSDPAEADVFVEYSEELRRTLGPRAETPLYLACKELADPAETAWVPGRSARAVAEIAARLYDRGLTRDGEDLLERCLENEQRITPEEVGLIVARLRTCSMPTGDLNLLLEGTVGRWSDAHRRDAAAGELGPDFRHG